MVPSYRYVPNPYPEVMGLDLCLDAKHPISISCSHVDHSAVMARAEWCHSGSFCLRCAVCECFEFSSLHGLPNGTLERSFLMLTGQFIWKRLQTRFKSAGWLEASVTCYTLDFQLVQAGHWSVTKLMMCNKHTSQQSLGRVHKP
jgi:hypothetical protein